MDLSQSGAGSIEPLLARAVGEPALAAQAREEIDRILMATETLVAEVFESSRQGAQRQAAEVGARTDAEIRGRRAELAALRLELLDQATTLARRFESLLDQLERAETDLAGMSVVKPAPAEGTAGDLEAIRAVIRERQRIPAPTEAAEGEAPAGPRRRWWHLWSREAA